MKLFPLAQIGSALLALALLCFSLEAFAQEKTTAGTRQYNAAVGLHNTGAYDLAAKQWVKFISDFETDPRTCRAWHYLGVCYSKLNKPAEAAKAFTTVVKSFPDCDLLEETLLSLGLTQYNMALAGKPEVFDAAAATFNTLAAKYPNGKHLADAIFYEGECLYNRGKKKEAAAKYSQVATKHPTHPLAAQALFALGVTQADLGQHKEALATYGEFLKKFPDNPLLAEATMWQGESQYALGQYAQAIKSYAAAAGDKAFKTADYAVVRHADALAAQKKYAEAAAVYASVPGKFPESKYTELCNLEVGKKYYAAALTAMNLGDYKTALSHANALLASNPSAAEKSRALHILGLCQKGLKKFDQAAATFSKLLEENPDYSDADDAYFELGWTQKSLKKEAEAAATFAKLLEKFPDSSLAADAHYLVGDFAYEKKDYKKASAAYHEAMTKAGKTKLGEEAAYKLGLCYYLQNDLKNAQQTFNYQRLTWPAGPLVCDAAFWEAESAFRQKKYEQALPAYEKVEKPSSQQIAVLALLHSAQAAAQLEQWEKCLVLAAKCVEQSADSPQLAQAMYEQGRAEQNLGKLNEALATYARIVKKSNAEPGAAAQFMIGEIQFGQKKHSDAIASFFRVIGGYGYPRWQADAIYESARCFEVLGRKPQAVRQYRRLVEKFPQSDKVPLAKQRIEALK